MSRVPRIIKWLAVAAVAEWIISRTLTRSAIFMPKSPLVVAVYQALTWAGQLAFTLAGLLGIGAMAWLIWEAIQARRFFLSSSLILILALSLYSLIFPPMGVITTAYHLLVLLVAVLLGKDSWFRTQGWSLRAARMLPVVALAVGAVYQVMGAMVTAGQTVSASQFSNALFNLGEALIVVTGIAYFWVAHIHRGGFWTWVVAALPALAFSVLYLINPAMTGIIAIWSMGLTLYLPWPLYAISLWLAGVGTIKLLRAGEPSGWAILLLAAGGYPPQLSSHVIMGLVALWLLATPAQTADDDHQTQNEFSSLPIHTVSA